MVKKILFVIICLISLVIFISILHGQNPKKTITLPNGDVIHDLNGEWDMYLEHYGNFSSYGSHTDIVKITQEGSSFEGIRMIGYSHHRKGAVSIKGELDKNGFKKVQLYYPMGGFLDSKGQISEDGNKMVIDEGTKIRVTYTRK
jgi:hypothetical protein